MFDFLKRNKPQKPVGPDLIMPTSSPVEEVIKSKQQGLTNDQIISKLKTEGYSFAQIQDAFSQAEIKSSVIAPSGSIPPAPAAPMTPSASLPKIDEPLAPSIPELPKTEAGVDEIERLLEEIIKEKWKDVTSKLAMLDNWKIEIDTKIANVEKYLAEMTKRMDNIQNSILAKNEEYGKTILDTQTEIQALEKVMGKLVPSMTDNIKELRELIEETKKGKPKPST